MNGSRAGPHVTTVDVQLRGDRLAVSCLHGRGKEEAIVYFHGLGSAKEDFLGAWEVAEWRDFELLAFDAPGCGATRGRRVGAPLGIRDYVAAAEGLVDHLGLDMLTLIGHSMGGLAALLFTLDNPGRVRRLVSVEGNLGPEDCALLSRRVFRERFLGREEAFFAEVGSELRNSAAAGFEEFGRQFRSRVEPQAYFDYCRSIVELSDGCPLRKWFAALEMPRLYVYGSENSNLSHIRPLAKAGVSVCRIPESNHFPAYTNPTLLYQALVEFVDMTA